jgi:hypothetical protein
VTFTSDPEIPDHQVASTWYETEGEKGKYVEWMVWHFLKEENKLGLYGLYEYDENGELYSTLTLHTALGPKARQTSKIQLGKIETNR